MIRETLPDRFAAAEIGAGTVSRAAPFAPAPSRASSGSRMECARWSP